MPSSMIIKSKIVSIIINTKTKEALPILIDKLKETDDPYITRGILVALEKQKDDASSYIPALEGIVKHIPDGQYKNDLRETIKYLRH